MYLVDSFGATVPGLKNAQFIVNTLHGRFAMKYLITGLTVSMLSTAATAGSAPVQVPEPSMLGLFAASLAALFIARKFRK